MSIFNISILIYLFLLIHWEIQDLYLVLTEEQALELLRRYTTALGEITKFATHMSETDFSYKVCHAHGRKITNFGMTSNKYIKKPSETKSHYVKWSSNNRFLWKIDFMNQEMKTLQMIFFHKNVHL